MKTMIDTVLFLNGCYECHFWNGFSNLQFPFSSISNIALISSDNIYQRRFLLIYFDFIKISDAISRLLLNKR